MGNMSNNEAYEGMQQTEQVLRPMIRLIKELQREYEQKKKAVANVLQRVHETKPEQFEPYVRETVQQLEEKTEKECNIMRLNGHDELADKAEQVLNTYKQDIDVHLNAVKELRNQGINPSNEIDKISKDIAGIGQLREELNKDNHEFFNGKNYENTMNKMRDIVEDSPIKGRVQFDLNKSKSIAEEVIDKPDSLAQRFKDAIAESKAFNMARPEKTMQKSMSQAMDHVL